MILYVDTENRIKDVNITSDSSLTPLEIDDTDNPFIGWSVAKICCYRVQVNNGVVTMMTPYVDSRLLEHIDMLGKQVETVTPYKDTKTAYIGDTEITFYDVPEGGNVTVFFNASYNMERIGNKITLTFEPLVDITDITISII